VPQVRIPPKVVGAVNLFVTPGDVTRVIAQVNEEIQMLQNSIDASSVLDAATHGTWNEFIARWNAYPKDVSLLPIRYLSQYHDVVDFQDEARAWEPILVAKQVPLAGPSIQPTAGGGAAAALSSTLTGAEIGLGIAAVVGVLAFLAFRK